MSALTSGGPPYLLLQELSLSLPPLSRERIELFMGIAPTQMLSYELEQPASLHSNVRIVQSVQISYLIPLFLTASP